jgi:hypothetical protein
MLRAMTPRPALPVLDAEHAAFMQQGVSIVVAACDGTGAPTLARAAGCRVAANRRRVTLFLWAPQCARLSEGLELTQQLAAVFSEICSHRTIQVKGSQIRIATIARADLPRIARYRDALAAALAALGHSGTFARTLVGGDAAQYLAVTFTPDALYAQTPGPRAGERIEAGA